MIIDYNKKDNPLYYCNRKIGNINNKNRHIYMLSKIKFSQNDYNVSLELNNHNKMRINITYISFPIVGFKSSFSEN